MDESILVDIRPMCNVEKNVDVFDDQLIPLINSYLFRAAQIGVGKKGFMISGVDETWSDFVDSELSPECFAALKSYVGLRTQLQFDPPTNAAVLKAKQEDAKEFEWCLYDEAEIMKLDKTM